MVGWPLPASAQPSQSSTPRRASCTAAPVRSLGRAAASHRQSDLVSVAAPVLRTWSIACGRDPIPAMVVILFRQRHAPHACHFASAGAMRAMPSATVRSPPPCGRRWRGAVPRRARSRHGPSRTRDRRAAGRRVATAAERALLHVAVARAADAAGRQRDLDEARAIEAEARLAAPEIGHAEKPLGDRDEVGSRRAIGARWRAGTKPPLGDARSASVRRAPPRLRAERQASRGGSLIGARETRACAAPRPGGSAPVPARAAPQRQPADIAVGASWPQAQPSSSARRR